MHVQNKKYWHFVFISRLTGKYATQKLKTYAVLVYGHVNYIIYSHIIYEAKSIKQVQSSHSKMQKLLDEAHSLTTSSWCPSWR